MKFFECQKHHNYTDEYIDDLKNRIKILEKALCQKDNEINTLKNELDRLKNNYR